MPNSPRKLVIVGGVAGGMSAAARARRLSEDCQILVLEKGAFVSYANCGLPYFLGREITREQDLILQTPKSLKDRFNIEVRLQSEVIGIKPDLRTVTIKDLNSGVIYDEPYDELLLSVGAAPVRPQIDGIDLPGVFTLRSVEDVNEIENWIRLKTPEQVIIAGGGFIGLEMAEQFVHRGLQVTLLDGQSQVLNQIDPEMAELVHDELRSNKVTLLLGNRLEAIKSAFDIQATQPNPKCGLVVTSTGARIAADMVILGLGVRPEIKLAQNAGLVIGKLGGIRVNERLETSVAHIWAVGDAIEVRHPISGDWSLIALGGPANRQGRIAADNIFGGSEVYEGTLGTAILRIFQLSVAVVGLNESKLKAAAIPYEVVYAHPTNHAGYYPHAERLDLKVLFSPANGRILGAQAIGKEGVDKRIDVIATAIKAQMSVRDLAQLELAYAPPFSSAKDPINLVGMVASNVLDQMNNQIHWQDIASLDSAQYFLLDVRSSLEREKGFIPGSIHIPLPELRKRLQELPASKTAITYCQSGQRSYFASRLLKLRRFNVKNLSGGFLTWRTMCTPVVKDSDSLKQARPILAIS